ncbi:predicted protein [Arabidopsis lyrata subsp. lyrata]|uniref:Predicted protein n=1 Tax=Arabidopsis lyrata subsp. lyrata TaxID=81972 RepID=D7KBK2_ARALL|nr:predicted protein [Arabidopsis lyrata subsp. lyrata]
MASKFSSTYVRINKSLSTNPLVDMLVSFHCLCLDSGKNGTYKTVCLYNSQELGLQNATTCEVIDFSTNVWKYIISSSPKMTYLLLFAFTDLLFASTSYIVIHRSILYFTKLIGN